MILLGSIFHLDFFNVDCRITRSLWKRAIRLFWEQIKYPRCFTAFQRFFSVTRLFVWVYRNASARGIRKRKSGTCLWLRFRKPPSWTFTVILLIISRRRWMLPDRNRNANRQWPIFFRYIPFLTFFSCALTNSIYNCSMLKIVNELFDELWMNGDFLVFFFRWNRYLLTIGCHSLVSWSNQYKDFPSLFCYFK